MDTRGRKSAASLTVLHGERLERVQPPLDLTEAESSLFVQVRDTKPADWWTVDNAPLLVEYVRALAMCDLLAARLRIAMESAAEVGEIKELLRMRDGESRRAVSLATRMRLSQQSTYNAKSGNTASRRAAGSRPWDVPAK
jgi:hypothetical protein